MTTVSTLDHHTTEAIRSALAEAGAGRLDSACEIGERALRGGGDEIALNAMLGMFRCRGGQFEAALQHLRPAHRARPADLNVARNLVAALVECGEFEEALAVARPEHAKADPTLQIARYRGYVAQLLGKTDIAAEAFEQVVHTAPTDWQSWNNLGNARLLGGHFEDAVAAFRRSLSLNGESLAVWLNFARALVKAGKFDDAEEQFRLAAGHHASDVQPLKELHDLMRQRGRSDEALRAVLERAITRAPEDRELLLAVGQQRMVSGCFEEAEEAFRSVLALSPADADAYLELAKLYEHVWPARLASLVTQAEAVSVPPPAADVLRVFGHRRSKDYTAALAALSEVPDDFEPWLTQELRGQFFDKICDCEAAFAAYSGMNEAHLADPSNPIARAENLRSILRKQLDTLDGRWIASWKNSRMSDDRAAPVFLVGFPRSGTTLLDTFLMGHPDVAVMEEQPIIESVSKEIGGFDVIPDLKAGDLRRARDLYFELAARSSSPASRMLVDKNPLHLTQVPLIHRLFPDARFILAVRHPADVILSCYFSNFRLTPALSNFLRLDTAAEYYDIVLALWERSCELMDINVQTVRYEKLIADAETELRPVIEALGLDWRPQLLDHQATAAVRGVVTTASYAQVTEPIYATSVGRWKRYEAQLEPVLSTLRPWIEKFGYTD